MKWSNYETQVIAEYDLPDFFREEFECGDFLIQHPDFNKDSYADRLKLAKWFEDDLYENYFFFSSYGGIADEFVRNSYDKINWLELTNSFLDDYDIV